MHSWRFWYQIAIFFKTKRKRCQEYWSFGKTGSKNMQLVFQYCCKTPSGKAIFYHLRSNLLTTSVTHRTEGLMRVVKRTTSMFNFALRPITAEQQSSLARKEPCASHVDSWLVRNKLKVSRGKTELLILNASHRPRPPIEAIQVSSERIMLVSSAWNIGVVFDQEMTLVEHVTTIIFI